MAKEQPVKFRVWIDARHHDHRIKIFGLTPLERHLKALRRVKQQIIEIVLLQDDDSPPSLGIDTSELKLRWARSVSENIGSYAATFPNDPILIMEATDIVDARLYTVLAATPGQVRAVSDEGTAALLKVQGPMGDTDGALSIDELARHLTQEGRVRDFTQAEFPAFIAKLRRSQPYYILRVRDDSARRKVERFLFWSNYKGSTDFFTKYVYPPLVWLLVRPLARWHVHPNTVTFLSIVMTFAAVPLFAHGWFWSGLALAYGMSVLDSVDGKLARLTFTDSKWGNILDHGLDIVHPPLWYLGWAAGLTGGAAQHPLVGAAWLMTGFYILDRFVLSIYKTRYGRGLHTHAPIDGFMRTFISRRNINLPLFTLGLAVGLAAESFYLMVGWQILTVLYHGGRTAWILLMEPMSPRQSSQRLS